MRSLTALDWIAIVLLIIGGLNWGILGIFSVNVIGTIFGDMSVITRVIYVLVGIAAVYLAIVSMNLSRRE